ncbi:MAG: transposase [Candidatus Melainabacteria bacterium]|nr:transposase [Candidatus Melainabacteria bacterium]
MSLQLQDIVRANVEHQEKVSKKILDELLRLSHIIDGGGANSPLALAESKLMSDSEIAAVIKDVDSSLGVIEVCQKHDIPLAAVFQLRSKFRGMNELAIHRSRELEEQCTELTQRVETLLLENKRLSNSKTSP